MFVGCLQVEPYKVFTIENQQFLNYRPPNIGLQRDLQELPEALYISETVVRRKKSLPQLASPPITTPYTSFQRRIKYEGANLIFYLSICRGTPLVSNGGGHIAQTRNRPPPVLRNREFGTSIYVCGRHIRYVQVTQIRNPVSYAELSGEHDRIFRIPQIHSPDLHLPRPRGLIEPTSLMRRYLNQN